MTWNMERAPVPIDSLEEFTERFCYSLASELDILFLNRASIPSPHHLEFYGCDGETLLMIKHKMYTNLRWRSSPFFKCSHSLRTTSDFPSVNPGTYYVDVGYFFKLYERRKSVGKNVEF